MSAVPRRVVRLDRPEDLVAAVPHLLGFHPSESLVLVALRGDRRRLTFSMRLDLPAPEHEQLCVRTCAARMRQARARDVVAFVYTAAVPSAGDRPRRALVDALAAALPLRDALLVNAGRVWSYLCDDTGCCPPDGRPVDAQAPAAVALAAAHALDGQAVLPSREEVVRSLQPVGGVAAASMRQAAARAAGAGGVRPLDDVVTRLRTRYADPRVQLSHDDAAALVVALHDVPTRDDLLRIVTVEAETWRPILTQVVRLAQPPGDAPVCTVLGWLAYVQGDGVVVATMLERALRSDPAYSLAGLLMTALDGQVEPNALRRLLA